MVDDGYLFSKSLIKAEDEKELIARPLHIADFDKGDDTVSLAQVFRIL